jgi:RimJ/RimL family protein N-acetyltransferase
VSAAGPLGEPVTGGPAGAPMRRPVEGTFVRLEPVDPTRHLDGLFDATNGTQEGDAVWTYLGYGPFPDRETMDRWLSSLVPSSDPLFFTVVDRATEKPVGVVSYLNIDRPMRHVEIGHVWYVPAAQRTRANTESTYLLLREAFEGLGNRRVEWKCDALNARSRAAAERMGFTFEGVFRRHMIVKGRNRDTAWFSVIDAEWPGVRSALERWLASEPGARPSLASLREAEG